MIKSNWEMGEVPFQPKRFRVSMIVPTGRKASVHAAQICLKARQDDVLS